MSKEELTRDSFIQKYKPKLISTAEREIKCQMNKHKNTLKGIRSAINRLLSDIGMDIDIVHAFKQANGTLAEKLE